MMNYYQTTPDFNYLDFGTESGPTLASVAEGGPGQTTVEIPSGIPAQRALFFACGFNDWENQAQREKFWAKVNPAKDGLFDGMKTWFEHSGTEQNTCIRTFASALGHRPR